MSLPPRVPSELPPPPPQRRHATPARPVQADAPVQPLPPDQPQFTYPESGLDCSPDAQARRWQQLQDLESRLFSGVQSTSDRNRQVTFVDNQALVLAIRSLRAQLHFCQFGVWPSRGMRLHYMPQLKHL